jgi:hypothetical protein
VKRRYIENNIGAAMRPALLGAAVRTCRAIREAGRFHSANIKIFMDFSYSRRFAY